jgi:riboflavin kinase/FMN adenylyltransferase
MTIKTWDEFVGSEPVFLSGRSATIALAATVGVFDGLHLGHQALVQKVLAQEPAMKSCVVTFTQNPKDVLRKSSFKGNIFSLDQKIDSLAAIGVDLCVLIDFSPDFGKHSGEEFVRSLYSSGVRFLCVGPNFRCGHNMDTSAADLPAMGQAIGMQVAILDPVMYKGFPVSSSRVRKAILEGNLEEVRAMLGRPYEVWLRTEDVENVDRGRDESDEVCFRYDPDVVLPPDGAYSVGIQSNDGGLRLVQARVADGKIYLPEIVDSPVLRVRIFERVTKEA